MIIRYRVHTFVALMAVLTFSTPLTTLAQQKSVQTEVSKIAAEKDRNTMILAIKAVAEQDASNDIDQLGWFGMGLGIAYAVGGVGGFAGCIIGSRISPPVDHDYFSVYGPSQGGWVGSFVGAAAGVLASIIGIYYSPVHVPAERLTGKSPEYVESYTRAYQSKMRSLKTQLAALGAGLGCGVPIYCLTGVGN